MHFSFIQRVTKMLLLSKSLTKSNVGNAKFGMQVGVHQNVLQKLILG